MNWFQHNARNKLERKKEFASLILDQPIGLLCLMLSTLNGKRFSGVLFHMTYYLILFTQDARN